MGRFVAHIRHSDIWGEFTTEQKLQDQSDKEEEEEEDDEDDDDDDGVDNNLEDEVALR